MTIKTIFITIKPDGEIMNKYLDHKWKLEEAQEEVKGCIETVPYFTSYKGCKCTAYVNEDGLSMRFPFNPYATRMRAEKTKMSEIECGLVGNLLIVISGKKGVEKFMREEENVN